VSIFLVTLLITFVISRVTNLRWIVIIKLILFCQCDVNKPENYINPPPSTEKKSKIEVIIATPDSKIVIVDNEA
jgi:hypothetical protein